MFGQLPISSPLLSYNFYSQCCILFPQTNVLRRCHLAENMKPYQIFHGGILVLSRLLCLPLLVILNVFKRFDWIDKFNLVWIQLTMQNQIFRSLVERLKTLRSTIEDSISIFHFASSEVFNTNENLDDKKFLNDDGVMRFSIKVSNVKIYLTRAWTENNPASSESSNHPVFVVPGCCLILQQRLPRMKPRILVGIQPTDLCRLCQRKKCKVTR